MRVLVISDTHGLHSLVPELPEADVFIHAGDFMNRGRSREEILSFNAWLDKVPVPPKKRFICAGNHDIWFDEDHRESSKATAEGARRLITNGIYVEDEPAEEGKIKFYFSPRTPFFLNWAFNVERGEKIKKYWDRIPEDTNFLVTHGPPYGILDKIIPTGAPGDSPFNLNLGCEELAKRVKQLPNLKHHVFGHIHGSRGQLLYDMGNPIRPLFTNASFLDERYKPHPGPGYFLMEM